MNIELMTNWITDRQLNAVCWTLLHSLWIGLIIAAIAALIIACTRRATPARRYQLFCALLVLFVGATVYAYYCELGASPTNTLAVAYSQLKGTISSSVEATGKTDMLNNFVVAYNRWSGIVFFLWLICFTIQAIRLSGGLLYSKHISHQQVSEPGSYWQELTDKFGKALGIEKKVTLLLSKRVSIPVAIGFIKPVILLPAGILLQLSPEQIEAVIWHELEHIRRHDYLVNILQRVTESVFFFNPALLWLSKLIREEREACCDDVVLAHVNRKSIYLEALMAFQQQQHAPGLAMHLRKSELMERLRRMVHKENKRLNWTEKIALISSMFLLCSFTFLHDNSSGIKKSITEARQAIVSLAKPAVQPSPINTDTTIHLTKVQFRHTNADRLNCEMGVTDSQGNRYYIKLVNGKAVALSINDMVVPEQDLENYAALVAKIKDSADTAFENKRKSMLTRQQNQQPVLAKKAKHADDATKYSTVKKGREGEKAKRVTRVRRIKMAKVGRLKTDALAPKSKKPNDFDTANSVIAALLEAKVIGSSADIEWYVFNHDQLVVNGHKQPDELHQKLVVQFSIKTNFGIYYGATKIHGQGLIFEPSDIERVR